MNPFLASAPWIGWLLLALGSACVVALYRLKPRPVPRAVSSTWLWRAAAERLTRRPASWRWWLGLALAIAIAGALIAGLTWPQMQGLGDGSRRVVVLLENGPSMAARTRDGQTRWEHAVRTAQAVIASAGGPVMLVDCMGALAATRFLGREQALEALAQFRPVMNGQPVTSPLPEVPGTELHLVGDGVSTCPAPAGAIVHSVFEPADNVAVIRLVARPLPADPLRVDAFVQVVNASVGAKSVRLTLRGGAHYTVSQELRLAAGERVDATFDVSGFPGGVLAAAAITQGDAFPADDIAYTVVQPHRMRRIQLVTRGNAALADALAALPGVQLRVEDPARYRAGDGADAYVFDGFAPPRAPGAPALLFRPPPAEWLPAPDRPVGPVAADDWDRSSAVAAGLTWSSLTILRAAPWSRWPQGVQPLVRMHDAGLVLAGRASAPWIAVGFAPGDSDLPLRPGFMVFLGSALDHLLAADAVHLEPLGAVRIGMSGAEVLDGQGRRLESRSIPEATLFTAERPDVYTVRSPSGRALVAAAVLDPQRAEINATRFAVDKVPEPASRALPLERWTLLVLGCIALLLLDWAAAMRRITR